MVAEDRLGAGALTELRRRGHAVTAVDGWSLGRLSAVARTPDEALRLAGDAPEVIVFGGAEVFREFMPMADRMYLTEVDADVGGDTYFDFAGTDWVVLENRPHEADERHPYAFRFLTLERIRKP